MSASSKILVGFGGMIFAGILMIAVAPKKARVTAPAPPAADESKNAAQLEKEQLYRNSTAGAFVLRRSMKDPSSFELVSAKDRGEGIVCYQYKARNSFGALLPDTAVLTSKGRCSSMRPTATNSSVIGTSTAPHLAGQKRPGISRQCSRL